MKQFRTPERITFPYGYVVEIERVPLEGIFGDFDDETRTIRIAVALAEPRHVRYVLLHEMDHAFADWKHWVANHVPIENPHKPAEEPVEEEPA